MAILSSPIEVVLGKSIPPPLVQRLTEHATVHEVETNSQHIHLGVHNHIDSHCDPSMKLTVMKGSTCAAVSSIAQFTRPLVLAPGPEH
jgi:hypothetical protein